MGNIESRKSLRLSRLDLCCTRKKIDNNINVESFLKQLKQCYQKVFENKAIKNYSLQKSYIGWILKIGKRGSPNYYRVYENDTDWLIDYFRRQNQTEESLVTGYFENVN